MKKSILRRLCFLSCTGLVLAWGNSSLQAQSMLYWDPLQSSGSGGTGTWNFNSSLNWFNGGADVRWTDNTPLGTNTAVFGGTAGTVTVSGSLSVSNLYFSTTGYTLAGTGPLTLGGGINTLALGSGTVTLTTPLILPGAQQLWQSGSGATLAVNGSVTRNPGASLDFSSSGVKCTGAGFANDATGVIGGWATVNDTTGPGANWAANDGSGNIIAYSAYTAVSATASSTQSGAGAAAQNWITGAFGGNNNVTTLSSSATINSLVLQGDFQVNSGVTLTLGNGGLLLSGVSRWMLDGNAGTSILTTGTGSGELFVHVPENDSSANNWTLWPLIINNGSTPLIFVKDGPGLVKLGNMNTYTGGTLVNAGTLASTAGAEYGFGNAPVGVITPFGYGPVTVNNGGVLQLGSNPGNTFGEYDYTNPISLNNASLYEADAFHHLKGALAIGSGGAALGATYDGKGDALNAGFPKGLFIDGVLTGNGPLTIQDSGIDTANAWDSSTVYFTSLGTAAQNTYSGTISVVPFAAHGGSYLYLVGTNALANATINLTGDNSAGNGRFGAPALLFGSGTNLDGAGYATIGGLAGSGDFVLADTLTSQSGSSLGAPVALTVGNNNSSSTYSGIMSGRGSLIKTGSGILTLSSAQTFTGNTVISAGTLALNGSSLVSTNITVGPGATFDISAASTTLAAYQALYSGGTINGSLATTAGSQIYMGTDGGYGTNGFNNNLNLAAGAGLYFDLGTSTAGPNDLLTVAGTLTANNNVIHIKAPGTAANLQAADYTLITSPNAIAGSFGGISWDVLPANAAHYSLVAAGNTLKLHYTAVTSPTGGGLASPATAVRNQTILLTVTATNGTGGTINSVTVDTSPIGGSTTFALVAAGANVWTNTLVVAAATTPGSKNLAATLTDTVPLTGVVNIPLTVTAGNDVWNGAAGDNNWSSNLNWTNKTAPGLVGDSVEFAGTTRLTPNLDNNYTNTSLTFDSGAGSFNIGTSDASTLTLLGGVTNNSANTETLNVPIVWGGSGAELFNAAAGNMNVSGIVTDAGAGVTKVGAGALTLSANSTITGPVLIDAGTLNLSGTISPSYATVGNVAGSSVLGLSGNLNAANLFIGNASNTVAAVYQTAGSITLNGGTGDFLNVGNVSGSFGYLNASGGSMTVNGISIGGESNPNVWPPSGTGDGIMDVNGASITNSGWITLARGGDAEVGILNMFSGSLTYAGGGVGCNWQLSGAGQVSIINILGGTVTSTSQGVNFRAADTGILNLNGGLLEGTSVTGPGTVNFSGGTLQAATSVASFLSVNNAYVFAGGATIDNNGQSIGISQAFLAPTGKGVHGIASFTGGAGYIAPPIIIVTNGPGDTTGSGATAIAQINRATGTVTNILITCPGVNYTATPVFIVSDGNPTTPATVTGTAPTPNASGGFTSVGGGSLTLYYASTYLGATIISNGTLYLDAALASTNVWVNAGATFDVSAFSYTLAAGQAISGDGTVNGIVTAGAGSLISGGTYGSYGTNTFSGNLTLNAGAACSLAVGPTYNGNNGQLIIDGLLTANGNVIHLQAPSSSANLDITQDYVLITSLNTIAGAFASAPVWDVPPANAGHYSIVTGANTVTLHYSATAVSPTVVATAAPATVVANQTTRITAVTTPGNASIASVVVDLSPVGGATISLVQSNSTSVYTNTVTIPASAPPGGATLTVTTTDTASLRGSTTVTLTVNAANEVWNGAGPGQNWSANGNWAGGLAPAFSGDSIEFAGTAGLAPNLDTNYSVTSLTFDSTAGSFNIGTSDNSTLTLTGGGSIVNNSANAQTLNVPIADVGGGINKSGPGAVTLAANNTYTGQTTVSQGTLTLAGTVASTTNLVVGTLPGNAVVNLSGSISPYYILLGNVSGSASAAYQTGDVSANAASGYDNLSLGNVPGTFGYYDAIAGTLNVNGISIAGEGNNGFSASFGQAGNGRLDINGATVNDSGWLVIARNNNTTNGTEIGVLNVFSGSLTYAGGGLVGPWDIGETAIINILGGSVANTAAVGVYLGNTGSTGILNLNGGVLEASVVTGYNGPSYAPTTYGQVNFNGGTLQASAANSAFIAVSSVEVYGGGATIDNNGNNITINQALLAPTGNGVHGFASFTGGAGYIAPPIITITNGPGDTTGSGATAIAQINRATGTVTNILITCPGVNYTAAPLFIVSGGGAATPATVTGSAPTANVSGGLTAVGSGITTLSGVNTYTGNTTVNAGTLEIAQPVIATGSTVTIAGGAQLQLDFSTTNFVTALVLNGASQPAGVYNNTTSPSYITGTGSLQVGVPIAGNPTNITFSVSGSTLSLSWPTDHLHWILQQQTNSLAAGLGTNWVDVAGSDSVTSMNLPVSHAIPATFFRLRHP